MECVEINMCTAIVGFTKLPNFVNIITILIIRDINNSMTVGLGGLGVTCSPRDPRFAGSNPAVLDEFFQGVKILSTNPPGGTLSWGSRVGDFRSVKKTSCMKK